MDSAFGLPGVAEWLIIALVMMLSWAIPIAIAVWVIITLANIRRDIAAIRKRLEASQQ